MRSHGTPCLIFSAAVSLLLGLDVAPVHAQLKTSYPNIWQPAQPLSSQNFRREPESTSAGMQVRQANFQDPGSAPFPGGNADAQVMPPTNMPGIGAPPMDAYAAGPNAGVYPPNQNISPAAFNQFSNPGGAMVPTQVQEPSGAQLRPQSNQPPQNYGPNGNGQAGYYNTAMQQPVVPQQLMQQQVMQQQVMPPNTQSQMGMAGVYPGDNSGATLRPANNGVYPGNNPGGNMAVYPGQNQMPVVSGNDPRFVSQPSRPGNYSTTPYMPPFRTVAYQLPQQSPPVQPVQQPSPLANQVQANPISTNQPQNVGVGTSLPQYQPTVGARLANYQVQQPGYCAPSIPTNGVPAFVPGAVAPPTLPPNLTPQLYTPDNAGYRPLFSLGQENYNVQLGRGIIGQPTVYVAGQPIRNFLRYLSP